MSDDYKNKDVDFDFFDDPRGSPVSHHSEKYRNKSQSPSRSASRSHTACSSRSPSTASQRSRSRSRSRDSYSNDFSEHNSNLSGDRSRSSSPRHEEALVNKPPSIVVSTSDNKNKRKKGNDRNEKSDYLSDSSVNSDVTDVSPLYSPTEKKSFSKSAENQFQDFDKYQYSPKSHDKPPNSGKRRPTSSKSHGSYREQGTGQDDSLNMKILMEVLAMEQEDPLRQEQLARAKKVLFVPPGPKAQGKKNFSFSNDQVDSIDRENQRLMEKITKGTHETNSLKQSSSGKFRPRSAKPVLTSSAVNRQRQQQKIEQENLAMLKRLQTAKATTTLRRDRLLHAYHDKLIAGQSVAAAHANYEGPSRAYSRAEYGDTYMSDMTEPATVILNNDSSKRLYRPTSASTSRSNVSTGGKPARGKRRAQTAKVRNDRW